MWILITIGLLNKSVNMQEFNNEAGCRRAVEAIMNISPNDFTFACVEKKGKPIKPGGYLPM